MTPGPPPLDSLRCHVVGIRVLFTLILQIYALKIRLYRITFYAELHTNIMKIVRFWKTTREVTDLNGI